MDNLCLQNFFLYENLQFKDDDITISFTYVQFMYPVFFVFCWRVEVITNYAYLSPLHHMFLAFQILQFEH